ncbi:MAG: hypothetical protein KY455_04865 [Euryarchaeota archaeon]|nr:hypothetical protein [Euryarchaeota archaeon]
MNKKLIALIIAGVVGLPMAAAATTLQDKTVVTGHTVYANMGGFDPDVALIAGIVESKVVWFNGMTVLNTVQDGFIYTVAKGQCDPRDGENFEFQDYKIAFRDPNNVTHIIAHYTYSCGSGLKTETVLDGYLGLNETKHVWVTPTHARVQDPPIQAFDPGRIYNFATGIDTWYYKSGNLLLGGGRGTTTHEGTGGGTTDEVNNGDSYCASESDHVCNGSSGLKAGEDTLHEHNTFEVDLYYDKEDRGNFTKFGTTYADGTPFHGTEEECANDPYCAHVSDPNKTKFEVWAGQ